MSPALSLGNGTETFSQYSSIPANAIEDPAVFATRSLPDWWKQTRQAIEELRGLEDNWDSYDAYPIHPISINLALGLMEFLAGFVGVTQPTIGATPAGQVGLSWDVGVWSLDATIREDGSIQYSYLDESDHSRDVEKTTNNVGELVEFLAGW